MAIQSKNPATGEVTKTFDEITDVELEAKLAKAAEAFNAWKKTSFADRAKLFMKLSVYLIENKERLGKLSTLEMGKPVSLAGAEIEKSALTCEYFAENAEQMLSSEPLTTKAQESFARFDPLGVILGVMPWNFPYWQVYRGAAPAIMAGNVMVVKHASNVPQCALEIEKSFLSAGFPEGVYQNVLLGASRVEKLIQDPRIAAITLTGSEKAGSQVASVAGREIKKCVLELGGSDPFIVREDADLTLACQLGQASRISNNSGQACNAAKRFIVHKSIAKEFTKQLADNFKAIIVGDPTKPETQMGPLASPQILDETAAQVEKSLALGAKVEAGGKRIEGVGNYYEATVLSNVKKGMPVFDEEVFGPVAAVIEYETDDEAIALANDTPYGLGATILTQDRERGKEMAKLIDAGNVFINTMVRSDPRAPFGGIKKSGYGRELGSYGIKEFVNIKTILVN